MSLIPNNVWFGTENDMRWVPAPLPNYTPAQVRWRAKDQYLNGGAGVRQSTASHKELSLSWPVQSQEDLAPLVSYLQQAGPYFYLDPLNAEANAVPAYWSMPGLVQDGPPLIPGVAPSYVPTVGGRTLGYPTTSAVYTVEGTPNPNDTIRNYITNPEFKPGTENVEVWRNHCWNGTPQTTGVPAWQTSVGSGGLTIATFAKMWSSFNKYTNYVAISTADGSNATYNTVEVTSAARTDVREVSYIGATLLVATDQNFISGRGVRADFQFVGDATTYAASGPFEPSPFYTGRRITFVVPVPEGKTFARLRIQANDGTEGRRIFFSNVVITTGQSEAEVLAGLNIGYFDGRVSPDPDLTPVWDGATGNSASALVGKNVPNWGLWSPVNSVTGIYSERFGGSLRILKPTGTYGYIVTPHGQVRGRFKVTRHQDSDFEVAAQRVQVALNPASTDQPTLPDNGDYEFLFDNLNSAYRVGMYHSGPVGSGQSAYYTKAGVFPPDYTGPWFDGDSDPFLYNGKIYVPSWAGTPHNSQSIATAYEGNADTRIRIPVPSGYTLHVGLHGSGPGISVGGVSAPAIPLTSTERTNLQYSTPGIATIQLLPGTHVISGIIAQVRPTGDSVPRGGFIPGMGHSQLVLDGDPTVTHYSVALSNAQTGIAADFVEVGAWQ